MKYFVTISFFLLFSNYLMAQQNITSASDTKYSGAYLGLDHPGKTPHVFAPGIISGNGRLHCFPSFSNDNKEIYWMVVPPQIMTMKETRHGWSAPDTAAFAAGTVNQAPFVSHDNRIYFSSPRTGGKGAYDIWYVKKTNNGYSAPINIGKEINSEKSESQPSLSGKNTMFYTGSFDGKLYDRGIYYSRFENGKYQPPAALPEPINIINENNLDYTPFIASDESYLLFCSNRQNPEKELCHIYISYKRKNGEWGEPIDLSVKMNFTESAKFPYITQDKKFLFFSSGANIYWVDSEIIKVH